MSARPLLLPDSLRGSIEVSEWTGSSSEWTSTPSADHGKFRRPVHRRTLSASTIVESPKHDYISFKMGEADHHNHSCGTMAFDEQSRRTWISADNPEKTCGHRHRTLVLCFDGTGDQFDDDNSNVVQFFAMLRKDDNSKQLVYYQAGLGTYTDSAFTSEYLASAAMTVDMMIAWNLESHVKDGYAFLMQNYTHGDKISIFGFSRGAYTARALAGMLQKVGLLPVCNHQQLRFAYDMYKRDDKEGLDISYAFKKTYSRSVIVDFLGVWDTVASVGLIPRHLPLIYENTGVRYLRHALSLDERRVRFIPQFCGGKEPEKFRAPSDHFLPRFKRKPRHREQSLWQSYEELVTSRTGEETDAEEVWFAGVHCDVGGGATPNWIENKLARIPLRWMIRECFNCNTGLLFDARMLQKIGLPVFRQSKDSPPELAPLYDWAPEPTPRSPRPPRQASPTSSTPWWRAILTALYGSFTAFGALFLLQAPPFIRPANPGYADPLELDLEPIPDDFEYQNDIADCRTQTNDEFGRRLLWLVLDWLPQRVQKQKAVMDRLRSGDSYTWIWNRGKGRTIPETEIDQGLKVHRTVKMRLEQLGEAYVPQARPYIRLARFDEHGRRYKEPRRLTHHEWNDPDPEQWTWVGQC